MSEPMRVYWAQFQIVVKGQPKSFQFAFEAPYAELDALLAEIRQGGAICVNRLDLTHDGRGGSLIRRRERIVLGLAGLTLIQSYDRPVREPEG